MLILIIDENFLIYFELYIFFYMSVNYNKAPEFKTDLLANPETAQVRDVETMRIVPAETKLQEALAGIKQQISIAQYDYYEGLESDYQNNRKLWFKDNGPITQEMLNMYCAENLANTGGSNFIGRKLPMTSQGKIPVRCQYVIDASVGGGPVSVGAALTHFRDLTRMTPLCESNYSSQHVAHTNGTRCGVYVRPAGKGTLTFNLK
jgi:hypothetical protein